MVLKKLTGITLVLASVLIGMFANTALASVEQPISFLQYDSQWGSKSYTSCSNYSQTMANSGCGPTAAAMVINYYVDETITPVEIADYALDNGYRTYNNGTAYGLFSQLAEENDLEFLETSSSSEALNWMQSREDSLIICSMAPGNWTRNGHYILLWKIENGNVYINDPGSTNKNRLKNTFSLLSSQAKRYFCFNKIEEPILEMDLSLLSCRCDSFFNILNEQIELQSNVSFYEPEIIRFNTF